MNFGENNVGKIDRGIRCGLGLGITLGGLLYVSSPWSYVLAIIGILLMATGVMGTCPVYTVAGISTMKPEAPKQGAKSKKKK